jgi:nitrous-oxide reductase
VGSGKLAATLIPVFSFEKIQKAIAAKDYEGEYDGIPVLKYESVLHGEVKKPGLGPLHTEFDDNGFAYTSMFVSSEIVKWNVKKLEVVDRVPTYYSIGHLSVPGGDSKKPWGKYVIAYNKITKDRYLPTGPELAQSAQLYSIDGDKMELLAGLPVHRRAALRTVHPRRSGEAPNVLEVLQDRGEQAPLTWPRVRRRPVSCATARRCTCT